MTLEQAREVIKRHELAALTQQENVKSMKSERVTVKDEDQEGPIDVTQISNKQGQHRR